MISCVFFNYYWLIFQTNQTDTHHVTHSLHTVRKVRICVMHLGNHHCVSLGVFRTNDMMRHEGVSYAGITVALGVGWTDFAVGLSGGIFPSTGGRCRRLGLEPRMSNFCTTPFLWWGGRRTALWGGLSLAAAAAAGGGGSRAKIDLIDPFVQMHVEWYKIVYHEGSGR